MRVEADPRDLGGRPLVEIRDELPRLHLLEPGQDVGARRVGEVPHEALAEEIAGLSGRPAVEAVDRLILAREVAPEGGHAAHHARVGVSAAAEGRLLGLLVHREALDHPGRSEDVRKEVGGAAEHAAAEAGNAAGRLEVHDVGELVGEDEAQPALEVAEVVGSVGRHRTDVHEGIGHGGGVAVRVVVGVEQDDLHPAHAVAVASHVLVEDQVGHGRRLARHGLEALVEDHGDPAAHDRPEMEVGRHRGRSRRSRRHRLEKKRGHEARTPGGG